MQSKVKLVISGKLNELIERQKIQRFNLGKLQFSIFYHGFAGKYTSRSYHEHTGLTAFVCWFLAAER
jgi:hypothetical protein